MTCARHTPFWPRVLGTVVLLAVTAEPSAAAPPPLYHSPNDDGVSAGLPADVSVGEPVSLHLYLGIGSTLSTADPCHQGDGEEICGHRIRLVGHSVSLHSFTPADSDTLFYMGDDRIDLTGGDFQTGALGPTKLGDLVIEGADGGTLQLVVGEYVDSRLAKIEADTPRTIISLPEPAGVLPLVLGCVYLLCLRCLPRHRGPG